MDKIIKLTLVGLGIFAIIKGFQWIKKAANVKQIGQNLIIDIRDFSISPPGFNLVLINQTSNSMKITKPVVEFFLNEKSVAYSSPDTQQYQVNPQSETKIRINLKMKQSGVLDLISNASGKRNIKYSLYADGIFIKDTAAI